MSEKRPRLKILPAIACSCIVASLLPWWSERLLIVPPTRVEQSVFTIGVPWSPWFERVKEKKENPDKTVIYSTKTTYFPISLSAAAGAVGVILLIAAWCVRPAKPQPSP
jgi:hypothetical protein